MKPITAVVAMSALVIVFIGGLVFQRCSFERQFEQQQATATKADKQLIDTTRELGAEHVEQAQAKATTKRAAASAAVQVEVQHAEGDSDLADYLTAIAGGDGQ